MQGLYKGHYRVPDSNSASPLDVFKEGNYYRAYNPYGELIYGARTWKEMKERFQFKGYKRDKYYEN